MASGKQQQTTHGLGRRERVMGDVDRDIAISTRSVRKIVARAGKIAGLPGRVHPHQLRHACGYYLATNGHDTRAIQDYLGHRNIQHTVRYTQLNPSRFESFWTD